MAAHARLKNEFTEDEKCHYLMTWLKYECVCLFVGKKHKGQKQFAGRFISIILTYLANIANGEKSCSILQQFTGRKSVTLFGAIL